MEPKVADKRRVAVIGLGYVGGVTAACLAELGHSVVGVDRDEAKVRDILEGRSPFYEPGLEPIIARCVEAGTLRATTSLSEALQTAHVALICVGTPSEKNGNLGLDQVRRVVEAISAEAGNRTERLVVAVRSTVFPGTCEQVVEPLLDSENTVVVSNPEFLREGSAVKDFREPSLIVVGGSDREAVEMVASLYGPLGPETCLVSLRTAELIKYACNAFHAVKISFANEIGALAEKLGIEAAEVMDTLCRDNRLNISKAYLKPGFAFGGSCLPKDLRALTYRAARLDLKLPFLESVLPSNDAQLARGIQAVLDLPGKRIGILGLAFKENTDDLRESPIVSLLEYLIGKGREVRVYDPHIQLGSLRGANLNYILNAIPHIGRLLETSEDGVLDWADQLVIAQKLSPDLLERIENSGLPVLSLVGELR